MSNLYYDKNGKEIDKNEWSDKFADRDYKQICVTTFPDGGLVSTIWLGLNHSWEESKILIFESMAFLANGDELQQRYSTLEEARKGHVTMVEEIYFGMHPELDINEMTDREV